MPMMCPSVGLSRRVNCLLAKLPSPSFSAFTAPILHVSSQMQIVFGAPGWPWSCSLSGLAALRHEMLGSCAWIINFLSDRAWGPVGGENCQTSSLVPTVSLRSSGFLSAAIWWNWPEPRAEAPLRTPAPVGRYRPYTPT